MNENKYQILLKFTYYEDRMKSNTYLLKLDALKDLRSDKDRAFIRFNNRKIGG